MSSAKLGQSAHYVSYGTPGGEYTSRCRAAVITGVPVGALPSADLDRWQEWGPDAEVADLFVMNPSGTFFNRCPRDEEHHRGGTFHYPDGCDA